MSMEIRFTKNQQLILAAGLEAMLAVLKVLKTAHDDAREINSMLIMLQDGEALVDLDDGQMDIPIEAESVNNVREPLWMVPVTLTVSAKNSPEARSKLLSMLGEFAHSHLNIGESLVTYSVDDDEVKPAVS